MVQDWLVGGERRDAARERLVAHAAALIARRGLDAFDLDELGRRAHCSRATIYRHAGGRAALIESVLATTSAPVLAAIRASIADLTGPERARTAIIETLRALRGDRVIRQFLRPDNLISATPTVLSSPAVHAVAADLVGVDPDDPADARFLIRSVLAMLLWPAEPDEEARSADSIVAGILRPAATAVSTTSTATDDDGPHP
ncbi:TetR/AcrR family transcriptional regulator [Gordonia lacunae]|uniref:TetR family transcriptional regulator n=1 Tax=Gordonia lacunae TaxID=417102 RepID=A0A243QAD9_9ACTN|nr:helix-turn-helix domain-containing protein [Gordonia lacunae]OUC78557.1 TetR family transcriptional regulator [Gordonia lacunae]